MLPEIVSESPPLLFSSTARLLPKLTGALTVWLPLETSTWA